MAADTLGLAVDLPSLGHVADGAHHTAFRIYVEDTDAGGVVYHAKYLHFFERARTQFLASIGFGLSSLMSGQGDAYRAFVVRRAEVSYHLPARLDDVLISINRIARLGGASIDFEQKLLRDGREVATAMIYVGCIDGTGRPRPLPPSLASKIREISKFKS